MSEIILVAFWTVVFACIFGQWKRLTANDNGAWRQQWIVYLFLLKVTVGIFYGWSSHRFLNAPDSRAFYKSGKIVYSASKEYPLLYLRMVFLPLPKENLSPELQAYKEQITVWKNRGSFTIIRLHAFFSLFTAGSYYANIVFWNALSTIGIVLLWRSVWGFACSIKQKRFIQLFLCFNPALLFWASGAHKEGIALFAIGVVLFFSLKKYNFNRQSLPTNLLSLGVFLAGFVLLFSVRHYYFASLILALLGYFVHTIFIKKRLNIFTTFVLFYTLFISLVIVIDTTLKVGVLRPLIKFRTAFIDQLQGRSDYYLSVIDSSWVEVVQQIPVAIINSFFRPFVIDVIHIQSFLASTESLIQVFALLFCLLYSALFKKKKINQLSVLLLFFGGGVMLIIGLVVDNSGAMVRYRSVPYTFMLLGALLYFFQPKTTKVV